MALSKIQFQPGIVRETTNYTQSGGWFDCDKVRFRAGMPEKIGGWQAVINTPFQGTCRYIHQWSDLETDRYIALGTSSHLYILWSSNYYDITPLRTTIDPLGTDPFTTGHVGTTEMYVTIPGHYANVGDYVTFSGATTGVDVDQNNNPVYTPDNLNQQFKVTAVIDDHTILISMPTMVVHADESVTGVNVNAGAVGGGGPVKAQFLIPSGLDDAVVGAGWGIPPWGGAVGAGATAGPTGWGEGFNITSLSPDATINQLRLWAIDNFGQDLVANIRNGPIYYWHHSDDHTTRAVPLNQQFTDPNGTVFTPADVPDTAVQVITSPNDRHLIAMGCQDIGSTVADPLLVRWSDTENAYMWTPLRTNSAGGQRLSAGSYIICALRTTSGQILIWTDLGLWLMQYIGMPFVFGFQPVAQNLSIIGPNTMINAASIVMWMDRGIFYTYTGTVQELPCSVKDYVFSDLNYTQSYKIYAGHNHALSEVWWFYPSASSIENDSYVIYNYGEQLWSVGRLERTAWLDMGRNNYPVATDRLNSFIYYHEYGCDADGAPLPAWIDSADIDASGGDHYLYLQRFVPDVQFRGCATCNQSLGVTIFGRSEPLRPKSTRAMLTVTPVTGQQYIRVRDRQISFRFESDALGMGWRLGTIRADWQQDGRR